MCIFCYGELCWQPRARTNILALKPGVGQNIARYASVTASYFCLVSISTFPVHSPSFFHLLFLLFNCYSFGQQFLVCDPRNKIAPYPAHSHHRFMQVPAASAYRPRNINRYQTCYCVSIDRRLVFSFNCELGKLFSDVTGINEFWTFDSTRGDCRLG